MAKKKYLGPNMSTNEVTMYSSRSMILTHRGVGCGGSIVRALPEQGSAFSKPIGRAMCVRCGKLMGRKAWQIFLHHWGIGLARYSSWPPELSGQKDAVQGKIVALMYLQKPRLDEVEPEDFDACQDVRARREGRRSAELKRLFPISTEEADEALFGKDGRLLDAVLEVKRSPGAAPPLLEPDSPTGRSRTTKSMLIRMNKAAATLERLADDDQPQYTPEKQEIQRLKALYAEKLGTYREPSASYRAPKAR